MHAIQDAVPRADVTWRESPRGMSHFGGLGRPLMSMEDPSVNAAWRDHRRHVLDIAFRMIGNLAEAEDVVQEAFARLLAADVDAIDDVGGWLVVVSIPIVVDFPAPLGPRKPKTSPGAMSKSMSLTASTPPG